MTRGFVKRILVRLTIAVALGLVAYFCSAYLFWLSEAVAPALVAHSDRTLWENVANFWILMGVGVSALFALCVGLFSVFSVPSALLGGFEDAHSVGDACPAAEE